MTELNATALENALTALGEVLRDRGLRYEVVAIGGGGLLLLGCISRPTRDIDLVALVDDSIFVPANPLPSPLLKAAVDVGDALHLGKSWLNAGPSDLFTMGLPNGFMDRMETRYFGALTLHLAGRFDQICFKLYAAVDQGPTSKHFADLTLLQPTIDELAQAASWCKTHDVSEGFARDLQEVLREFKA